MERKYFLTMMVTYFQLIEKFLNIDITMYLKMSKMFGRILFINNLLEETKKIKKGLKKVQGKSKVKVTKLLAIFGHYNNIQLLKNYLMMNTLDTFSKILYLEGNLTEKN